MAMWRKHLYITLARNAISAADYFHLPADRTVTIGSSIDL
jgi:KUP system potassium uptake protein